MHVTFAVSAEKPPAKPIIGTPIGALIAKREQDPKRAAALTRARKKIGEMLSDDSGLSLSRLRLAKGLSQAKLAEMMGSQQPYIARIESGGDDDIKYSTMQKFAEALEVDVSTICAAIQSMREARGSAS